MAKVFRIEGDIDLATAPELGTKLLAHAAVTSGDLTLDCSAMTFIDSSGIQVLLSFARHLRSQDRVLHLTDVRPSCHLVFDVAGVGRLIGLEPTDERRDDSGEIAPVSGHTP
jgi:anti-anti-sigma factor